MDAVLAALQEPVFEKPFRTRVLARAAGLDVPRTRTVVLWLVRDRVLHVHEEGAHENRYILRDRLRLEFLLTTARARAAEAPPPVAGPRGLNPAHGTSAA